MNKPDDPFLRLPAKPKRCLKFLASSYTTAGNFTNTTSAWYKIKKISQCPSMVFTVILAVRTRVPKEAMRWPALCTAHFEASATRESKKFIWQPTAVLARTKIPPR